MHNWAEASESGVLYLVNDHRGKRLVRRPRPPPTSPPLDEDFDAVTQECTTRGPETEWGTRVRDSWVPTSPPLDEDFDAVTYTVVTGAPQADVETDYYEEKPRTETAPSVSECKLHRRDRSIASISQRPTWGYEEFGMEDRDYEYKQHRRDMSRSLGSKKALESGVGRLALERLNGSSMRLRRVSESVLEHGKARRMNGSTGRRAPRTGPKAGQEFDVVHDQILEDGPERTVTISTWRERVAKEAKYEDMSVYYMTQGDYEMQETKESPPSRGPNSKGKNQETPASHWLSHENVNGIHSRASPIQYVVASDGQRSFSPASKSRAPPRDRASPKGFRSGASPSPRGSTSQARRTTVEGTSSSHTPLRTSTPNKSLQSPTPFIPTRSGSTISSIRSIATTTFQEVLSSCEPSLLHVAPALVSLGIKSVEHLRAVGRLTEEVRDREVRDGALKKGLTVMEWAILLDKLRSL
ncbi:uncharacterized protein BT62DRAFT_926639 [Guyanagaster necrorhizus]|uniref:Uncharacterized protein n=1 Tax=Guyanagaster necrorhizus TaxID=856835 RepID=A0A9P8AWV8_9AGAR|nr:uncharacterized protein BT62DRAFT_926639 [Guyanagaster necrorhizus MCA 3950]KAG7450978.1 hypothetical protein BT62DRAFT_926639 [Guyanagaster necrorhizus MCA 3950]